MLRSPRVEDERPLLRQGAADADEADEQRRPDDALSGAADGGVGHKVWVHSCAGYLERLKLSPSLGMWLDNWLELLADDTHPHWAARSLSLSSLARLTTEYKDSKDWTMRKQLKSELNRILLELPSEFRRGQPEPQIAETPGGFPQRWAAWLGAISVQSQTQMASQHLAEAIERQDLDGVTKWTRLVVNDLLGQECSRRELLQRALTNFVPTSSETGRPVTGLDSWKEMLAGIITPSYETEFTVKVPILVTPPRSLKRIGLFGGASLLTEDSASWVVCKVTASHPETAALRARPTIRKNLAALRTQTAPGRVHLAGDRLSVESEYSGPLEVPFLAPPRNPFWGRGRIDRSGRRFADALSKLEERDKKRWLDARELWARPLADWPESAALASTSVWIALEALSPKRGGLDGVQTVVAAPYKRELVFDLLRDLAVSVSSQAGNLTEVDHSWSYCEDLSAAEGWLASVLSKDPGSSHTNWRPRPTEFMVNSMREMDVLLGPASSKESTRVDSDLAFLYGLRNAMLHRADLGISENLASYLTSVGLAVLGKAIDSIEQFAEASSCPFTIEEALQGA